MERWVRPDGRAVRRRRHERAWSPRDLLEAVALAHERATGLRDHRITPVLLQGIEERDESVPWETLDLLASGFDCEPVELLAPDPEDEGEGEGEEEPEAG